MKNAERELANFKRCTDDAPDGAYEAAKELNDIIGDTVDALMRDLRAAGYKANNCDLAFSLEAAIYQYVKQSNPESTTFPVSEGFGEAMLTPVRDLVIANAKRNIEFFRSRGLI